MPGWHIQHLLQSGPVGSSLGDLLGTYHQQLQTKLDLSLGVKYAQYDWGYRG